MNKQPEDGKASVKCTCNEFTEIYDCKKDCDAEPPIKRSKASVDVLEANCTIAEFMGMTKSFDTYFDPNQQCHFEIEDLKYHSSWDWLKPVIDEIFTYALAHPEQVKVIRDISIVVEIGACWEKVVEFITWHNQNKQS